MLIRLPWYSVRGVKPDTKGDEEFYVRSDYVDHLKESGQIDKWRAAIILEDVLSAPAATFKGLQRPGDPPAFSEGLIYCGKPPEYFDEDGKRIKTPANQVLAVYVIQDDEIGDLCAFDWDWKEEDARFSGHPKGWKSDYGEPIWPPKP